MRGRVGSFGDGDDGGMLDHQDAAQFRVWGGSGIEDLLVVVALNLVGLFVGHGSEGVEGWGGFGGWIGRIWHGRWYAWDLAYRYAQSTQDRDR